MKFQFFILTFMALFLVACFTPPQVSREPALAGNYVLDTAHTSVVWRVSHVGLSHYTARFDNISGTLLFDSTAPENSRVDILIDPASISTGDADFDKTIGAGGKYFNIKKYPEIRYRSTNIKVIDAHAGIITGDLTFRGITHPVNLSTVFNGAGKSFGHKGKTLGFSATGKFLRSDFGLTTLKNFGVGDEISLHIEAEFNEG